MEVFDNVETCYRKIKQQNKTDSGKKTTMEWILNLLRNEATELSIAAHAKTIREEKSREIPDFDKCQRILYEMSRDFIADQKIFFYPENRLPDLYARINERNSGAEQILHDIRAINERNLASACSAMDRANTKNLEQLLLTHRSGNLITLSMRSKFGKKIGVHRDDFKKLYNCEGLLESSISARYNILKDSYMEISKRSRSRIDSRVKKWISMDNKRFEWTIHELESILSKYRDASIDPNSKRISCHKSVERRFASYCQKTVDAIPKISSFQGGLPSGRNLNEWKMRTIDAYEAWYRDGVARIENNFIGYLEEVTDRICELQRIRTSLLLREKKLDSLSSIPQFTLLDAVSRENRSDSTKMVRDYVDVKMKLETISSVPQHSFSATCKPEIEADTELSSRGDSVTYPFGTFSSLELGTRLRQMCTCCAIPFEDQEDILLSMLFDEDSII